MASSNVNINIPALQPGSTNKVEVKKLQDFLLERGYMTQSEIDTGYGIYGNKTKAAVSDLQQALGVDTAGYPGYWGPKTISAVSSSGGKIPDGQYSTLRKSTDPTRPPGPYEPGYNPYDPSRGTSIVDPAESITQTSSQTGPQEGDTRVNSTTGKTEMLDPTGTWIILTPEMIPSDTTTPVDTADPDPEIPENDGTETPVDETPVKPEDETTVDPEEPEVPTDKDDAFNYKDDPDYQNLNENGKVMIALLADALSGTGDYTLDQFNKALDIAGEGASAYVKEQVRIVRDSLSDVLTTTEKDLASQETDLATRLSEINQDLIRNKENLTTDETAELSRQARSYSDNLDIVRENMAQGGLSSSSIRIEAKGRLDETNKDIVESTQRRFARARETEQISAERGRGVIDRAKQDYARKALEAKTSAVKATERVIGSENLADQTGLPDITGLGLGGVEGTIGETAKNELLQRAEGLLLAGVS